MPTAATSTKVEHATSPAVSNTESMIAYLQAMMHMPAIERMRFWLITLGVRIVMFVYGVFVWATMAVMGDQKRTLYLPEDDMKLPGSKAVRIPMRILGPEDMQEIRQHVDSATPFVIRGLDKSVFTPVDLSNYEVKDNTLLVHVRQMWDATCWKPARFAYKYLSTSLPWDSLFLVRIDLMGSYDRGLTHIDILPTRNFYYLQQGEKLIDIVPKEYTDLVDMTIGIDNSYVTSEARDFECSRWLENLPAVYETVLQAGDVLCFDNGSCLHKFKNLAGPSVSQSFRVANFRACYRPLLRPLMLSMDTACHAAHILSVQQVSRNPKTVGETAIQEAQKQS
ncbi:hypothetical protein SARC_08854 [Sphaeroforma arctica JP610]|uniref:Uncharacterized protein n=1 Tax=Sphaeroforma arctica JP610 TaxID=667725 RepID=A0A0L0FQB8_9EUKA|nr:hypothetical protein SARC_08854 [Sphaeroforma arctica JP610]KNC78731.1 hypothetical protein SARC_08854 [Sphaeroforma arctica JP610]|eukprot:XP_014152633.1 hypothetical protein SARC_08854 [Sphaeroforma arctica JP610]